MIGKVMIDRAMSGGASYQLQDFIPFTIDIYLRLLERLNETFWPLHLLTLAVGVVVLLLAVKQRGRLACLLLTPVWGFVGYAFFIAHYAQLNWAGGYIGYAFIGQAVLLLFIAISGFGLANSPDNNKKPAAASGRTMLGPGMLSQIFGAAIVIAGLIALPLMAPLTGGSWLQGEVFGIHADPTAIATLGLALMMLRGWLLWLVALIPALWLLVSGLTLQVLQAPGAMVLFVLLVVSVLALIWRTAALWLAAKQY